MLFTAGNKWETVLLTDELRCVTKQDVDQEINKLRSDTSTGMDQIPVKFVKLAKNYISGPITHIINKCIVTSSFPKLWKTARIFPIPKVNEPRCDAAHRTYLDQ